VRAFHPVDVAVFEKRQGALGGIAERHEEFRRQRIFLRASMAVRIRSAVVRLRPMALQIHAYASSKVDASWMRSSTVSSTPVQGGSMAGCLVRRIASDRRTAMPGIFSLTGFLEAGTVMVMTGLGSSIRPCRSAAVWWLRTASGPARSKAAQSTVSRAGSPEKATYTPRCSRCQRPLRTRVRIVSGSTPTSGP
jgi:hypothetical protein